MRWLRKAPDERDLEAEITFHLEQEAQLRADRGETLDAARTGARRAFGSVALATEKTRAVWAWTALEQLLQDVRFGCRILTKSPALSAAAVLLIALVIGGNTTVFSMANGFLTKPAQGVTAKGLIAVAWSADQGLTHPYNALVVFENFRDHASTFERVLAYDTDRQTLNHGSGAYAVQSATVSANYFETLGVRIARGRVFRDGEAAAVISHFVWQSHFQGAEDVIGMPVTLNGRPATVVGVTVEGFRGTTIAAAADVWVPLERADRGVAMIGRLASGSSIEQARAELSALWSNLQAANPTLDQRARLVLVPYSINAGTGNLVDHRLGQFLAIFSMVTLITLLIVCANVANLLVSRALIRQRETALRQSLGASRWRIVRAQLAEGLTLSVVSWAAACLWAWWVTRGISGYLAPNAQGTSVMMPDFTPDWTVLAYAFVLAVLCTVICSMAPVLRTWRQALLPSLKAGEQAVIQGRSRLSRTLVVVQIAFSVLLVTCAGLAFRSIFQIGTFSSGFDTRQIVLVTVNTAGSAANADANAVLLERLRSRLTTLPGVRQVTYAERPPQERWASSDVTLPGSNEDLADAETNRIGAHFFDVMDVEVLAGRAFVSADRGRTARPAIISQNLAERLWPGESPLGRVFQVEEREQYRDAEVVGVVPHRYFSGFRREPTPFVFFSAEHQPRPPGESALYVRYEGSLDIIGPAIGRALQQEDSRTAIAFIRTWDTQIDSAVWPVRMLTTLLMLFAGGSLLIAAIGQYAVMSFDMRRRFRELGLRIALGASSTQVLSSVLREGFVLTATGLAIGFALSLAVGRLAGGALYGITATDPMTYVGVLGLLSTASLAACYLPARRAARINPIAALRIE